METQLISNTQGSTLTVDNNSKLLGIKRSLDEKEILRKAFRLSDITILSNETIAINDKAIRITSGAFKQLINILGLNNKVLSNFGTLFDESSKQKLIKLMKDAMVSNKDINVVLFANKLHEIVAIKTEKSARHSGLNKESALNLIESMLDHNHDLQITNYSVTSRGQLFVNLINTSSQVQVPGFSKEIFSTGVNINNSIEGTIVSPSNIRLVCTNGMTTSTAYESFHLNSLTDEDSARNFYMKLDELKSNNYVSKHFFQKIESASKQKASVNELLQAKSLMTRNSDIGNDIDLWIPYTDTLLKYQKHGIDINMLNETQSKSAHTGITVYDLVNSITDFASHNYNYSINEGGSFKMQTGAGSILMSDHDLSNIMTVNPFN